MALIGFKLGKSSEPSSTVCNQKFPMLNKKMQVVRVGGVQNAAIDLEDNLQSVGSKSAQGQITGGITQPCSRESKILNCGDEDAPCSN